MIKYVFNEIYTHDLKRIINVIIKSNFIRVKSNLLSFYM